ncbi:MAG: cytochrome c3 family protein [Halieaceae bacterium]
MRFIAPLVLLAMLSLLSVHGHSETAACSSCHEDSDSSMHAMLGSKHGPLANCESCHGPSLDHLSRPTLTAPDVSFGPRWSASAAAQDGQCLECHQDNTAAHWRDSLHMVNNVTCISCHDLHVEQDRVLQARQQAEVCTICHKTQKTGIHGKERMRRMNPDCTSCHNPHADQRPQAVMMSNDSAGCRRCHKLDRMQDSSKVSDSAKTYHRVMDKKEMTCLACHEGVAHGATDTEELFHALPQASGELTLFYPGQSDSDWLLSQHPGSQPLRQGASCQTCHRGDEAAMGASLGQQQASSRIINTSFLAEDDRLILRLQWQGSEDDQSVAFMWGFGGDQEFARGGCWAACHADMPGMSRDRGVGIDKYLRNSRKQMQAVGQPALLKTDEQLEQMIAAGDFVELWTIDLARGKARVATLLADLDWQQAGLLSVSTEFADGVWNATIQRPLRVDAPLRSITPGQSYTFGMALHSKDHRGAAHWVSLPTSFSINGHDTNFRAE